MRLLLFVLSFFTMLLPSPISTLFPYTTLFRSKEIYGGDGDQIYTVAREGLEEDAPAAYHILEQYDESYEMLEELMPLVHDEGQDVEDVAQQFLDDNPDLVEEWTEGIQ